MILEPSAHFSSFTKAGSEFEIRTRKNHLRDDSGRRSALDTRHMRLLVVEDEIRLAQNVAAAFRERAGYAVDLCCDGEEALLLCKTASYDLIVLDLMLPKLTGQDVLRRLRERNVATPVLILTATTGAQSTVSLLNLGADDYLTKPFDLGELIARGQALIRRGKGVKSTVLQIGSLCLNLAEQTVSVAGQGIDLSPMEYRILEYLVHRPRTVVSKQELLEHLYDFTWQRHSNVIEAHVSNLRRKLREVADFSMLETFRGRGYRLGI
jgi:DNA-binding response OmpR family regulator